MTERRELRNKDLLALFRAFGHDYPECDGKCSLVYADCCGMMVYVCTTVSDDHVTTHRADDGFCSLADKEGR